MDPGDLQSPLNYLDVLSPLVLGGLLSSPSHVMNNTVGVCATKPLFVLETPVCGWSSFHLDTAQEDLQHRLQDW